MKDVCVGLSFLSIATALAVCQFVNPQDATVAALIAIAWATLAVADREGK